MAAVVHDAQPPRGDDRAAPDDAAAPGGAPAGSLIYPRLQAEQRAALRRALLDAASELLAREGFAALTVRRVAQAVGCSTTVLYTLFGNKAGLANALYLEGFDRLQAALAAVPRTAAPLADLTKLAAAYHANARANRAYYAIMFGRAIREFTPSEASRQHGLAAFGVLVDAVRAAIEAGALPEGSPEAAAQVCWATLHGVVELDLAGYLPGAAADQLREHAVSVVLAGLQQAGGARPAAP